MMFANYTDGIERHTRRRIIMIYTGRSHLSNLQVWPTDSYLS